jgi:hypothetical protein
VFNRIDKIQITLARMEFEMHRGKRLELQADAGIAQLLAGIAQLHRGGLSASFDLVEQSSSGDHSTATAVPSINDELQRAKTKLEADHHLGRAIMRLKSLADGQLKSICPLLRQRKLVASFELAGDTASYSEAVHRLALKLLWSTSARTCKRAIAT